MSSSSHYIYKESLLIDYDDEHSAAALQKRWSDICNYQLPASLDKLFSKYFNTDIVIKVNSIEIDTGPLFAGQTDEEWIGVIIAKIEEEIFKYIPYVHSGEQGKRAEGIFADDDLLVLGNYLQYGYLPVWADAYKGGSQLENVFLRILQRKQPGILEIISIIGNDLNARKRVAWNFSDMVIKNLVMEYLPVFSGLLNRAVNYAGKNSRNNHVWLLLLNYIAAGKVVETAVLPFLHLLQPMQGPGKTTFEKTVLNELVQPQKPIVGQNHQPLPGTHWLTGQPNDNEPVLAPDPGYAEVIDMLYFFIIKGKWPPTAVDLGGRLTAFITGLIKYEKLWLPLILQRLSGTTDELERVKELLLGAVTDDATIRDTLFMQLYLLSAQTTAEAKGGKMAGYTSRLVQMIVPLAWINLQEKELEVFKRTHDKEIEQIIQYLSTDEFWPDPAFHFNFPAMFRQVTRESPFFVAELFGLFRKNKTATYRLQQFLEDDDADLKPANERAAVNKDLEISRKNELTGADETVLEDISLFIQTGEWAPLGDGHKKSSPVAAFIDAIKADSGFLMAMILQANGKPAETKALKKLLQQSNKRDAGMKESIFRQLYLVSVLSRELKKQERLKNTAQILLTLPGTGEWIAQQEQDYPGFKSAYNKEIEAFARYFLRAESYPVIAERFEIRHAFDQLIKQNVVLVDTLFKQFKSNQRALTRFRQFLLDIIYSFNNYRYLPDAASEWVPLGDGDKKSSPVAVFIDAIKADSGFLMAMILQANGKPAETKALKKLLQQSNKRDAGMKESIFRQLYLVSVLSRELKKQERLKNTAQILLTLPGTGEWIAQQEQDYPGFKSAYNKEIEAFARYFLRAESYPVIAERLELRRAFDQLIKQNVVLVAVLFKRFKNNQRALTRFRQFLVDITYSFNHRYLPDAGSSPSSQLQAKTSMAEAAGESDWQALYFFILNGTYLWWITPTSRNSLLKVFRRLYRDNFAILVKKIKALPPDPSIISNITSLTNETEFRMLLANVVNPRMERIIIANRLLIQQAIQGPAAARVWQTVMLSFFFQLRRDGAGGPVNLLQRLIAEHGSPDSKLMLPGLEVLKKYIKDKNAAGAGDIFYHSIVVLSHITLPKVSKPPKPGKEKQRLEDLIYLLQYYQWPKQKAAGHYFKYLQNLQQYAFKSARKKAFKILADKNNYQALSASMSSRILIRLVLFTRPGYEPSIKKDIHQLMTAFFSLKTITGKTGLKEAFWITTFEHFIQLKEYVYVEYVRAVVKALSRHIGIKEYVLVNHLLVSIKRNGGHNELQSALRVVKFTLQEQLQQTSLGTIVDRENSKLIRQDDTDYSDKKEDSLTEMYVNNAGIVLAAPFIPAYFEKLSLLEGIKQKNKQAQLKAIHALQFLVTGNEEHYEYDLAFIKLLCGFPVKETYRQQSLMLPEEKDIAEGLLEHIIKEWSTIGNTSVEGLRVSFLQRRGKLVFSEDAIYLTVEQMAFDVLLDYLPWSISLINFSWMNKQVHTTWRQK